MSSCTTDWCHVFYGARNCNAEGGNSAMQKTKFCSAEKRNSALQNLDYSQMYQAKTKGRKHLQCRKLKFCNAENRIMQCRKINSVLQKRTMFGCTANELRRGEPASGGTWLTSLVQAHNRKQYGGSPPISPPPVCGFSSERASERTGGRAG